MVENRPPDPPVGRRRVEGAGNQPQPQEAKPKRKTKKRKRKMTAKKETAGCCPQVYNVGELTTNLEPVVCEYKHVIDSLKPAGLPKLTEI